MSVEKEYQYTPLPKPVVLTEQEWPDDVMPLVHTRTMTYNHEKFIRDCIEGILMQKTTFPVQMLIHDDASNDQTAEIIREYEQKYPKLIRAYYQKKNTYQIRKKYGTYGESRKEFFSWRVGKYEALCEGDDYWTDPLKLQRQVEDMESNDDVVLTYHKHKNVTENGKLIDIRDKPLPCTFMLVNDFEGMPVGIDCPNGDRLLLTYFTLKGTLKFLDDIAPSVRRHHEGGVMSMASEKEKLNRQVRTWSSIYEAFKDTKISDKLYAKKNMFTYRQMLYNWRAGDEKLFKILSYPLEVKSLKLYKHFIRSKY